MSRKNRTLLIILLLSAAAAACSDIPLETIKKKYTNGASRFLDIDGMKVHYRDEGSGPLLLLIHGTFASLHAWDGWTKYLSAHYRIIRMDLPGHGVTGPAISEYTKDNFVDIMERFCKRLQLKEFFLAGNSLGGYIAWNYARAHPERVKKLILLDSAGYPVDLPLPIMMLSTPVIRDIATLLPMRPAYKYMMQEVFGDRSKMTDELVDRYYELFLRPGNRSAAKRLAGLMKEKVDELPVGLSDIKMPVLIMWGEKDVWIPLEHARRFQKDMPNAKLIVYKGVGHIPMEEIPERTARDADAFLRGR